MKKLFFCISLSVMGLMTACVDKNEAVDADKKPDWLGGSIYQELKNPDQQKLTGTFNTYLRLIDDLGQSETLNRTGSKTVFPANDEAFARFFQQNKWGVTSYEQLTVNQKKLLLNNSMLDNAILLGMLSNVEGTSDANDNSTVRKGQALKHQTAVGVTTLLEHLTEPAEFPENNEFWQMHKDNPKGLYVVRDATAPMMVHFTREHMLANGITTQGDESDFAILTGTPYEDGMAYVFNDRVIHSDITCLNGYIHQMEDVIVPPGNMAQLLASEDNTTLWSHLLDYYSAPFINEASRQATNDYNYTAMDEGSDTITIYEVRYFNKHNDANRNLATPPIGSMVSSISANRQLYFDPGWNQYRVTSSDNILSNIAAMFVPTDEAVKAFFLPGGEGEYLIDIYGKKPNTPENLVENLDSLQHTNPAIITNFINNLMKRSFVETVPSKFSNIQNDATENLGMKVDLLQRKADGGYDIQMANNGVIYKLNEMISPDLYRSVMGPSDTYLDMQVMKWCVNDGDASTALNLSFSAYLMAMKANIAFFVPDDEAFSYLYIDPTTLAPGHSEPRALHFYYDTGRSRLICRALNYDPATGVVGDSIPGEINLGTVTSQLTDILNYHTVILGEGETLGTNHYYKTKHGGEIYVEGGAEGQKVMSGQQIDNGVEPATITKVYNEKNGNTYRINRVIEAPRTSVSKTLQSYPSVFSEFYAVCSGFTADKDLLEWAGISDSIGALGTSAQDAFTIFTSDLKSANSDNTAASNCLDENVKLFNTYNYTLYAPDNNAMEIAYAAGLPRWSEIDALREESNTLAETDETDPQIAKNQAKAYAMICALRDFVRYHFQILSVYADNVVPSDKYQSLSTDAIGMAMELDVTGGSGRLEVKDAAQVTHIIDANDASTVTNKMARDYWFRSSRMSTNNSIYTSSFCVVHELTEPLYNSSDKRYDAGWSTPAAMARTQKTYQRLKKENKL